MNLVVPFPQELALNSLEAVNLSEVEGRSIIETCKCCLWYENRCSLKGMLFHFGEKCLNRFKA